MDNSYIAGFFDGEGNVNKIKVKGKVYFQIRIYQKNSEVLEKIQKFLGYGNIFKAKTGVHELSITKSVHQIDFVRRISPHSLVKNRVLKEIHGTPIIPKI